LDFSQTLDTFGLIDFFPIKMHVNDVMVTAALKIIKNSNHSYVRNVLHILNLAKSGPGQIGNK